MKVSVKNEYGQLKSVILGRAEGANWPTGDLFFNQIILFDKNLDQKTYGVAL